MGDVASFVSFDADVDTDLDSSGSYCPGQTVAVLMAQESKTHVITADFEASLGEGLDHGPWIDGVDGAVGVGGAGGAGDSASPMQEVTASVLLDQRA